MDEQQFYRLRYVVEQQSMAVSVALGGFIGWAVYSGVTEKWGLEGWPAWVLTIGAGVAAYLGSMRELDLDP